MANRTAPPVPRTITQKEWCVIRRSPDGLDWIASVEPSEELARQEAAKDGFHCGPAWEKLHPIIGVRPCTITVEL